MAVYSRGCNNPKLKQYIHAMEYYLAIKRTEVFDTRNNLNKCPLLSFVTRRRLSQEPFGLGIQDTGEQSGARWEYI